ncbi:MAG: hypothetical protein SXG53_16950, partial [Pseudomonadota bacterium]|nr:hypothetical protein [Pseudomonadota bacterium]
MGLWMSELAPRVGRWSSRLLGSAAATLATVALVSYSGTSPAAQGAHGAAAPAGDRETSTLQEPQETGSLNRLRLLSEQQYLNTVR